MERTKRALVVDDSFIDRTCAHLHLESFGFKVECVPSGEEALDVLEARPEQYDVIFLDHIMPGMSGVDTARRIRQMNSEHTRRIPIVAWTGCASEVRPEIFYQNGFTGILKKPLERTELRKVLEAV